MPNNKPRYSLTVDGKQRTVEADKFNDNVSTFIQDMPDATIRMKDSNGAEKDVKLNDLSGALYTGYQYVTTDKPIYVNTKAPEPEKPQQQAAPKPAPQTTPTPAVAQQQPTQQPQAAPRPQAPSNEPGLIDKIVGAVNTAIGGQPSDMSLGGLQGGQNLVGKLFQSDNEGTAQQRPTPQTPPREGETPKEKRAREAVEYQQLINEQNKNVADFGNFYNQTVSEFSKRNWTGQGELPTPFGRYLNKLQADYLQGASDEEVNRYSSDPEYNKQKTYELIGKAEDVQDQFLQRKAIDLARNLVKNVDSGTPDEIQENLREAYFNKDNVTALNRLSGLFQAEGDAQSGNKYVYYRRFIQNYYMPAIQEALKEKFNGLTLPTAGLSWDMNDLTGSEGKSYDERWMNDSERATYDTLIKTFHQDLDKLNKEGEAAFTKQMSQETTENMGIGGREGHAMQVGAGASAERARNYAADPQKAVDDVLNKLYAEGGSNGGGGGATEDMDRQAIGNLLYRNMMKYLIDQRVPKSKWGYVLQGFADSDVGELFKTLTKTSYERHLDNLANDKYVRNLNGFTGLLAQGGHEATKFLADAWEYWLGGKAGKAVTGAIRRRAIAGLTADLTARGIAEAEAKNIAIRLANAKTKSAAEKAFLHAASGSVTLGSAQTISGGLRQGLTPAAGQKKAEIQERRANGETISKEQEDKEIAQANQEAHSLGTVTKSAVGSGLSGGFMGAAMGIGSLAGDATSKFLGKYFGDVTSTAGGYLAKLNTNAATATALGQAEGAITGEKPEGSVGGQFVSNLVNFAMLDGMNFAPKVLGGHPIRDLRQWKEYERSMGISEEDQDRMREAGYGDLMDTIDGLVSDRLRTGNPDAGTELSTQRREPSQQETKVNEGMLNMLADPRIPEELKRKYYVVVTGDNSKQLSPIVASEVTTDEDGNSYLVTYNKNGNVVSDRQYRNEKAAQEAQSKIGHEQDENLTEALQQNVFAKDADAVMEEAYNAAAEAYKNGGELNNGQRTLIYLYQNKAQLIKAIQAKASGEPLSESDQNLLNLYNAVQTTLYGMDGNIPRIANDVEEDNGLSTGGLQKARKGHTEKEAKRIAKETGEEIVHVGGDVWRTMSEDQAVKDYQQRLYDYASGVQEGEAESVAEPKGLPGKTEQPVDTQEPPTGPEAPTEGNKPTAADDAAQQRPTQPEQPTQQPQGAQQPTATEQDPQGNEGEHAVSQVQEGAQGANQVQQVREQGRQRGLSVENDETQLAQIQEDSDLANKRFNNAFQGNQLGEFRNGLIQAVENDDEDAIQALFDKYGDRLSTEQRDAAMGLVENGAVQNGIDESITNQTMQYQDARKQELDNITDSNGNITELTLQDGSTVYYKSGDITNQYGGIIATDGDGNAKQIPVSSIASIGETTSAKAILDEDTNNFAQGLQNGYQAMASGASMLPGQETTINVGGHNFHATMDTELQDGSIQLRLDDGSPLVLTPDQLQQARKAARDANTTQQLADAEQQRQVKEREDRYNKGVVGYGEGNPDFSAPKTDARTAAELMHEQDKQTGKTSKDRLNDIQSERDKLNDNIRSAQWEIRSQQRWLDLNGDTYSEEERARKQGIIDDWRQKLNDWQQRVRKLGEVRNAYMTDEERRQFQSNRRKTMDDIRKNTELGIKNGGLTPTTPQGEQLQVEVPDAKTLLEKYPTQADADAALSEMRDNVMKGYRDGSANVLSDVRTQLRDYEEGMSDLGNDDIQNLYLQQAGARQAEEAAMQQVQKIKNLQGQLSNIYKERNKAALKEMSPRERRASIMSTAKTPEDLQKKAHEAYAGTPMEGRLDDTEPESLEEYVSQNMPTNLNWEGTGSGITQKRGLKQELGLSRGIGRNFDSNGINSLLAPKGQGISVDEAAHALWEGRPSQFEGATTQDMRNTLLDLIANSPNARSIKSLTIRNRINEVEGYEQAAEEQAQWLQQQADEKAKARQAEIDTYNDYLDDTAKDTVPSDEVSDYLSGLYADEVAQAKEEAEEQEQAWRDYEKEKEQQKAAEEQHSLEPNNNDNGTERTNDTGEGVDSKPKQPTIHAGNSEGEAPLRAEETHKPNAEVQHNAQGRTNAGTETSQTGSGTANGSVLIPERPVKYPPVGVVHFDTETEEQSKAFEERIPKMSDKELLGYIAQDDPDGTKQYHPALGDEYDYRHRDEQSDLYNYYEPMLDEEYSRGGREAVEEIYDKAWQDWVNGGYASAEDRTRLQAQIQAAEDWLTAHDQENQLGTTDTPEKVETERQAVDTDPTEAQKEAGNYKKGHIKVDGYDISIENPKGSVRVGKDENGKVLWRTPMHYDYGYILGTKGTDGDHIDVYLSDTPTEGNVYVVDQIDQKTGDFDEHKVMYGFPSMEAARDAYKSQYEKGWKVGTITEVSREDFKKWVESSKRKKKPFSEYKSMEAAAKSQLTKDGNVDNERYSITKQHHDKKDKDIWVVRGKDGRVERDVFKERQETAKEHKGWYSSFRGVKGFVFNTPEDAKSFADEVFGEPEEKTESQNSNPLVKAAQETGHLVIGGVPGPKEQEKKPITPERIAEAVKADADYKDLVVGNPDESMAKEKLHDIIDRIVRGMRHDDIDFHKKFVQDDSFKGSVYDNVSKILETPEARPVRTAGEAFNEALRRLAEKKKKEAEKAWESLVKPNKLTNFAEDPEGQAGWVDEHFEEIIKAYMGYPKHGNKLDPDEMRKAFAGMGYNGKNVPQFRKQEGIVREELYKEMLRRAVKNGNPSITILTGVGGAGKSTATEKMDFSDRGLVLDSALNAFDSLKEKIEIAKRLGMKDFQVVAVYNDAKKAFENTLDRGKDTGRFLSLEYFTDSFKKNQGKIARLQKEYPDVDIVCIDNSNNDSAIRPNHGVVSVDEAKKWDYTINDETLNKLLDLYEDGINEGRFAKDEIASIGRDLQKIGNRPGEQFNSATIARIAKISSSIQPEEGGDLRPSTSGQQPLVRRDGIHQSGGERPSTQTETATGSAAPDAAEGALNPSEASNKPQDLRAGEKPEAAAEQIDHALDDVNHALSLVGTFEADRDDESKFNESLGYSRTAEAKAVKEADALAKKLGKALGLNLGRKKIARANIAPIGGDVTFNLPLTDTRQLTVNVNLSRDRATDDLTFNYGFYRIENKPYTPSNFGTNWPLDKDTTLDDLVSGIHRAIKYGVDGFDLPSEEDMLNAVKAEPKKAKSTKKPKKAKKQEGDLFGDLFANVTPTKEDIKNNNNGKDNTEGTGEADSASGADRPLGPVRPSGNGVLGSSKPGQPDTGATGGNSTERSGLANGQQSGLSADGSRGSAESNANSAGTSTAVGSGRGHSVSAGERPIGEGSTDRGTDGRPGAPERPERVSTGSGANAPGSNRGEGTERTDTPEEGTGVRGNVETKPARDEATATTRADDGSEKTATERDTPLNTRNYLYPKNGADIDNMSAKERLVTNVDALETLVKLIHENRTANADERNVLGKFRGWGGIDLSNVWDVDGLLKKNADYDYYKHKYVVDQSDPYYRLGTVIKALDPDGKRGVFNSIKQAALTSYYTPLPIAGAMNWYLSLAGYKGGGSMLDPSIGNGVFEGTMPKDMQQRTQIYGVELDWLTAQIVKQLYPDAHIQQAGYQEANVGKGEYDIVESNIPFGSIKVYDPSWRYDSTPAKKAAQGKIHTYFALKMMESAKPGGLVTIMTSNSIMDTPGNNIIRTALAEQGEFLGAVRLPDNTFKGAGTRVVTDVIFMRKYKDETDRDNTLNREGYVEKQNQFLSVGKVKAHNSSEDKDYDVRLNLYYQANPKMMLGNVIAGGQYRSDEFGLTSDYDTKTLAKKMRERIKNDIVGDRAGQLYDTHKTVRKVYQAIREAYVGDGTYQGSGNIVEQNGKLGILRPAGNDGSLEFEENPKFNRVGARIRLYIPIRTALKKLIAAQINREPDKVIDGYRKELNDTYKRFRSQFGLLNDKKNNFIDEDIDSYQMRSLEDIDEDSKKLKGLADIFTKNTIKPSIDISKANDPTSAIATSLAQYGEIRPSYMEKVLGKDWSELCGDALYKVPFSDSYVVHDDYLSGDVKSKLEDAKRAASQDPEYKRNVEALEKVQPRDIPITEINIRMGARWVPDKVYTDFMKKMFGIRDWDNVKSGVKYIPEADDYVITVDSGETGGEADKWATDSRSAKQVFEAAMKDKSLKVFDHHSDGTTTLNKEETELVNSKVQDLREAFETWVTSDPERGEMLEKMYNEKFNRTVIRQWSAPFLQPVGLQGMTLRPHQQAAVWMILNNRGGIIDHIVGAGKTLVMQSAIMEMRRMGIAKKPMIIALKATVGQIAKEFVQAYPAAKILAPTEKDFEKKNRKKLFAKIATNDYDCVIVSHDNYCKFAHTKEIESQTLNEQIQQLEAAIMLMHSKDNENGSSQLTKRQLKGLEKRKANLEARMQRIMDRPTDKEFCFENLGVDYLFVDECQRFKALPYATTYNQVAGLGDPQGSQKAVALLNGVRYLQQLHQGDRGTVFLSGTTITNSLVEVYNLLNYLRPNMMKKLGYTTFDAWAAQFAVRSSELEYGVTNELKEKNRFRYFQNVSELGKMYAEIADVRNDYNLKLPKPKPNTQLITIDPSPELQEINEEIVNMVRNKDGQYFDIESTDKTPWSLLASTLSTKASVSPRLIDANLPDDPNGKIAKACENVAKIYKKFDAQKGTQLIFCDTGVPGKEKNGKEKEYDAYSDIINRLVNDYGIPRKEIVDIHTANTDDKRKALFKKVRDGQVRILIGGTVNMGTGVNVQPRLVALHHIDIPWQPADTEQRNGRGVRQGNIVARDFNNNQVDIFYYAVKGTLDTYRYQLQDIKGKMFAQFKLNTIDADSAREFDEGEIDADGNIDPAQMVAMLSGNPVIFEKSKQDKLVKKLRRQESAEYNDYIRRKRNIESLKRDKEHYETFQNMNERDRHFLEKNGYKPGTPANDYKIVGADGKEYPWEKATDAGKIIHKLYKQAKPFTLEGYGMKAQVVQVGDDVFGTELDLKPITDSWGGMSSLPYHVPVSDTDQVAGQAFGNLVKTIYRNGELYKSELDKTNHKLEGSDSLGEFQFSKQKQLDEAIAKKKELDEQYKKLSDDVDDKPKEGGEPQGQEDSGDDGVMYRMADEEESAALDKEPTVKVYRAMQLINGKLYPPMMAEVKGSLVEPRELGQWEIADERPGIIKEIKKNKQGEEIGYVDLNKGSRDATGKKATPTKGVAYNPYWHTSRSPLNDQFASAWIRPNIVTVEVEVPVSELTSGYRAKYAKDPVGETDWHSGSVTKQLTAQGHAPRKVILSRYDKPLRVLSAAETADRIVDFIKGYDVVIPENVVTPQVRVELEKRGVKIGTPEKRYKKTEQIREAIARGLTVTNDLLREQEVFKDGETLPVSNRNRGYGVEGLNNDYRSLPELLEAFREKYPDYVATIVEDNSRPAIKVEPWRKYLADYTGKRAAATQRYTERQQERAKEAVNDWAKKLNLGDKITVITDDSKLTGKKAKAKGWFDTKSGKIAIVLPKHTSIDDVVRTILHEGVAHYGLRKLFGDKFDTFLDNVWNNADADVKRRLEQLAIKYDGNQHKATEEYLSGLAEDTDFDRAMKSGWWGKIKNFFISMLAKAGIRLKHLLTDNDLRYILWRSYQNMVHPGEYRYEAEEATGDVESLDDIDPIDVIEGRIRAAEPMPRRGSAAREHTEAEKQQMQRAAEEAGESLGGVKISVERNGHDGIKGSYNTEDDTVHVNLDEADDAEDIQATVSHEVLGHEGLKALFGSNKGVDAFGEFIYDNAGKALRRKIVERAAEEGYEWDDPLRYSKAAQEVFSDIASEGPANADEFSLWRKVKHYVIKAAKKLGLHIQGLVNDHDLRYYVLKTGKAVKNWVKMSDAERAEAAEPGRIMHSRRGKPKQKKGESMAHYIQRLREYEMWKNAEQKAREANDPLPEREDFEKKAQEEFNKAMGDWRNDNGIKSDTEQPGAFPKRKDGETPQEYAIRVADYESELDKWKTAPNVFDYLKKGEDAYRQAYEDWKVRYDIQEMEDVDEKLYGEAKQEPSEPESEEEHYKKMEIDAAVDKDLGDAVGVDTGVDGARRQAKLAVIERRKNLESASAEDAIFIHDLCKDIDNLAKELGMPKERLRSNLITIIEEPRQQKEGDEEVERWVEILNKMRSFQDAHTSITADGVKAARQELSDLAHEIHNHGYKPSTGEGRKAVHDAAVRLADKLNEFYKDNPSYNKLFGDDIMQVGKYIGYLDTAASMAEESSALGEDPKVKAIVDRIHDWYDNFFHVIEDAGLRGDAGYIAEGYINHIWDKDKSDAEAWNTYVENFQRTKSANMHHRTIDTYIDGIKVGLVPKFNDVAQIMSYYSRQNNEAIANKKFLDDLSFLTVSETNKDGEVTRTLPVLNSHKPDKFDEERYQMYHVPGVGDVWVLKDVARRFASIFGTMRTQDIPNWLSNIGKGYDLLGSTMKKIQLSISGFHMGALSEVALAQMRPDRGLKSIFKYILWDAVKHNGEIPAYAHPEDFKFAASHLVQLGATQDYAAADVNMITEKFRNYVKGLRNDEAFMKKLAGNAINPFAVAMDWINKGMDKLLWNYLHDGLKIACFKHFAEQIDRKVEKEGLTAKQRDRLLDEAGQYVNDTFGGQYWELLNVSPATLKWLRRAFLSPDWLISTQRHFFANFGFGSLYDPRTFAQYLSDQLPGGKKRKAKREQAQQGDDTEPHATKPEDDGDIYRQFRSKEARLCYVLGVCVFFYTTMNGINAIMRARDEEKEKEKADEIRKTNPEYKSPYELAYPDGMKWYDYTMLGNALGQQTHLFLGRYNDGSEMYVRWGKQFREFPEMFIGSKGLDFPAPMIQRLMGKANPVIGLMRDNLGALGIWGFDNSNDIADIQAKYGKTIGLLAMNARHFLPFSLPTQAEKEFKMMDLFMPSSKGFTRYKTVDYFKDFIKSGDMEGVARTYRAATMNGINAEDCLKAAITTLKAEQKDEMRDGIVDVTTACNAYDKAKTLTEKKTIRNKMVKLLAAENYKAFTRANAMQMVNDYMNGTDVAEKDNDKYIQLSTSGDVRADYRMDAIRKQAKQYADSVKSAAKRGDAQTADQLAQRYGAWLEIDALATQERSVVNKLKKQLGHGNDKAIMSEIRQARRDFQGQIDQVQPPK